MTILTKIVKRGRNESSEATCEDKDGEGITVIIRMRPLHMGETRVWKVLKKYNSVAQTTAEGRPLPERAKGRNFFTFGNTFTEECTTSEVYDVSVREIVKSVVEGIDGTVFAYGHKSSGKRFTMGIGSEMLNKERKGVVCKAADDIFKHISGSRDRKFSTKISFLEICNEEVRDLLVPKEYVSSLQDNPSKLKYSEVTVADYNSLISAFVEGEKKTICYCKLSHNFPCEH